MEIGSRVVELVSILNRGIFKSKFFRNPDKLRCPECNSLLLRKSGKKPSVGGKLAQRYECYECGTVTIYPKGLKKKKGGGTKK